MQQQDAAVNEGMKMELVTSAEEQLLNNSMHWSQGGLIISTLDI